jgi:uncharacterized protein (DUF1810 family)
MRFRKSRRGPRLRFSSAAVENGITAAAMAAMLRETFDEMRWEWLIFNQLQERQHAVALSIINVAGVER